MTVTSVRLEDPLYQAVKELAATDNVSVSTMMRRIIAERLEDEADYRDTVRIMSGDSTHIDPAGLRSELGLPAVARV